ncbi:MAG: hypothetical protein KKB51_00230 [Candidatus Riflebacteria bacterium]|nr:hypothetical protein [Candidatus Riflebacteria bacterium]
MNVADNPELCGLIAVVFVVVFIWANRCSKCGKLFTTKIRSRTKTSEGYSHSWEVDDKTQRAKSVRSYRYNYNETYACSKCGHEYSTSTSSPRDLSCGYFLSEESGKAKARGCFNPLTWWSWIPGKKFLLTLVFLFFVGLVVFDYEVLWYPTHLETYLDNYIEYLEDPFSPRENWRTQLEVKEGHWQTRRYIQEYQEVERENWEEYVPESAKIMEKSTKDRPMEANPYSINSLGGPKPGIWVKYLTDQWVTIETLTASGTGLPIVYPGEIVTAPGESQYGARKSDYTSVSFSLTFRETSNGSLISTDSVGYISIRDLDNTYPREISENIYKFFMQNTGLLKARIKQYSFNSTPKVYIYVEEPLY